ncbi:D-amino acid oxidase family protein [Isoalcanivorax pacificus W11-5]|uniref:tRNA 5-methylaminomethyl-2-thiouridine biosynthesis bifunctional protein MnmC n=1 Tax=Isoalcanivorax pacificus W11-5 TaxID=391936 RepID=A0A0B4XM69_9GAMM|nr:D-amino acid oxidase family protein [Isoalcanivorax pacificus W11-5]
MHWLTIQDAFLDDFAPLQPARIDWQDTTPVARDFDDPYFSRDDGPAETTHVFLHGNQLPERFAALPPRARFVIAETGFGTGLNFLCAATLFLQQAPADAVLHFVSAEKHPLTHADLARAHAGWPAFAPLCAELARHYPALTPGFHRLWLGNRRIALTLLFGDAAVRFGQLQARVDAWFLDGFAPARNPGMWTDDLFRQFARLSAPGASFATFTAAGFVRRGLAAQGFDVARVPGFGRKREMLTGHFLGGWQPAHSTPGHALVIGAGLAGATSARALAERGWQVTVCDPAGIAQHASGNLAGVVYTTPSAHATPQNRFYQSSYLHALHWLARHDFPSQPDDGALTGVLQLPPDARHRDKQQAALDSGLWPADVLRPAGSGWPDASLLMPAGGYLRPQRWCEHLLRHPHITVLPEAVETLTATQTGWQVGTGHRTHDADIVIIANAADATRLAGLHWLPLKRIRGQVSYYRATEASQRWSQAICHSGYLTPALDGLHCVGATFDLHQLEATPRDGDDARNLAELAANLPAYHADLGGADAALAGHRVGFRCQSTDFLPLAGPVPDACANPSTPQPGLYLSIAHGSRGITGTPLCAELIAALANDEPVPVDQEMLAALAPARFILRQRKKQPEWMP